MDINEQINGMIILIVIPITLTFLSHAGGHLYYKSSTKHEIDLRELSTKLNIDWKLTKDADRSVDQLNNEILDYLRKNLDNLDLKELSEKMSIDWIIKNSKSKEDIQGEIAEYLKDKVQDLWNGELLNIYQSTAGNGDEAKEALEMKEYYKTDNTKIEDKNKKVGMIARLRKDLYHGLVMIFWPVISLASYLIKQFSKKEEDESSNDDDENDEPLTSLDDIFKVFRKEHLADGKDGEDGKIKNGYIKYIQKLPFQALWMLEGGIGSAIKLSWVAFLIFIVIVSATLITTGGAFLFLNSLTDYQTSRRADLTVLINPILMYCMGLFFVSYLNKDLFKKNDGNTTIFNPTEFFKTKTFIMWNLLTSFFLFSIQMGKSPEFKNNYAFAFNLFVLIIYLFANSRNN
tara:strand:+ start:7660 stop:8865 length:1206 start_codon:yes stop_codon:yes gene_type:complete